MERVIASAGQILEGLGAGEFLPDGAGSAMAPDPGGGGRALGQRDLADLIACIERHQPLESVAILDRMVSAAEGENLLRGLGQVRSLVGRYRFREAVEHLVSVAGGRMGKP
jgi:hypothetical protein